jgi:hypothetical protein
VSFADLVYLLCAATSLTCAVLLARGYARTHARLLLWTCLCFVGLFLNNALLFVDLRIMPDTDLLILRQLPALVGAVILLAGLIWDGADR